jgi:hypothetical protein
LNEDVAYRQSVLDSLAAFFERHDNTAEASRYRTP